VNEPTPPPRPVLIAGSVLTADFGRLDRVVHKLERARVDRLHLDVMDGHFVPNLTFGPDVVAAFRRLTVMPIDVHLMISQPSRYVSRFIEGGPQSITFHVEAPESDAQRRATLRRIAEAGMEPGLALSPRTPLGALEGYLDLLSIVMVMTVEPGFGGQRFIREAAERIGPARELLAGHRGGLVHVDGGVNRDTASVVGAQGVDVCVVGSALFQRGRDALDEVRLVRDRAAAAQPLGERGPERPRLAGSVPRRAAMGSASSGRAG
jgi:ribulose-phosphate 3-epimerase